MTQIINFVESTETLEWREAVQAFKARNTEIRVDFSKINSDIEDLMKKQIFKNQFCSRNEAFHSLLRLIEALAVKVAFGGGSYVSDKLDNRKVFEFIQQNWVKIALKKSDLYHYLGAHFASCPSDEAVHSQVVNYSVCCAVINNKARQYAVR